MGCLTQRDGRDTLEIEVIPATILEPIIKFEWPVSIDLKFEVVRNEGNNWIPPSIPTGLTSPRNGYMRLQANIIEHAFIAYYEHYSDEINQARSKAGSAGEPTLAFANVIRNAFAHGGNIHFTKAKAGVTVSWGGVSYSDADNGRQVIYHDLSQGDVILLMLEMDKLF